MAMVRLITEAVVTLEDLKSMLKREILSFLPPDFPVPASVAESYFLRLENLIPDSFFRRCKIKTEGGEEKTLAEIYGKKTNLLYELFWSDDGVIRELEKEGKIMFPRPHLVVKIVSVPKTARG